MLGHRGCRLGITYPDISEMQARAIFEAAIQVIKEQKIKIVPEVMIPLIADIQEFLHQKEVVDKVAKQVIKEQGVEFKECKYNKDAPKSVSIAIWATILLRQRLWRKSLEPLAPKGQYLASIAESGITQLLLGFEHDT